MKSRTKPRRMAVATIALTTLMALPGTALASHEPPPGDGLIVSPFTLTCNGDEGIVSTLTPAEFLTPNSLGPGWLEGIGMAIPRSLTIVDGEGDVVFVQTNGKKTANGLETLICTGPAVTPDGPAQAIFEFVLLP